MKNNYELYEVPAGHAVVDIRNGEIIMVYPKNQRVAAKQFANCLKTLDNMPECHAVTPTHN